MTIDTAATTTLDLRDHQKAALDAGLRGLAAHDRGQIVMACGTGKTLTALRFAEARNANRVLVLLPSLALLAQTMREWQQQTRTPFRAVAVCSDPTVARSPTTDARTPAIPVTTAPRLLSDPLTIGYRTRVVVFATYHSPRVVAAP